MTVRFVLTVRGARGAELEATAALVDIANYKLAARVVSQ
jgi:hypothetical protein